MREAALSHCLLSSLLLLENRAGTQLHTSKHVLKIWQMASNDQTSERICSQLQTRFTRQVPKAAAAALGDDVVRVDIANLDKVTLTELMTSQCPVSFSQKLQALDQALCEGHRLQR